MIALLVVALIVGVALRSAGSPSLASLAATATSTATASAPQVIEQKSSVVPSSTRSAAPPTTTAPASPAASKRPVPPADDGSGLSQIYDRGTSGRPEIALTFDAGADRGYAEDILGTLADKGVHASFGITGHWAKENPDLVKRMVDEGHMLFNHTWNHQSFTGYSTSESEAILDNGDRVSEITDTEDEIKALTGYETAPYFRPPYGDYDDGSLADVESAGYWISVMWTCDSLGWNGASVDDIIARCGSEGSIGAVPGSIILMHVGSQSLDADALPGLIDTLQEQGFELVTVEELLQA